MFHRIFRCVLFLSLWILLIPGMRAQNSPTLDCPDTQPFITGADIVCDQNAALPYTYSTPPTVGTPTHSYQWSILPSGGWSYFGVTTQNQLKVYWQTPGVYTVKVTEWNNDPTFTGCIGKEVTKTVTVQPLLHAYFYYQFDPTGGCFYNIVNFTGDVSVHPPSDAITYTWDFGDGSPVGIAPGVLQHTFPTTAGVTYTVKLTVTNPTGRTDQIIDYVYVDPNRYKPVANFTHSATPVPDNCLYNPMTFDGSSSTAINPNYPADTATKIIYHKWDFNDPGSINDTINTFTVSTITHIFKNPGTHNVTLTVVNSKYCENTFTIPIVIDNTIPIASFTNTLACLGEATQFTNTSFTPVGVITQLDWVFDDGSSYTSTNPAEPISHTYLNLGTYTAKLRITNSNHCVSDGYFTKTVSVNPSPMASFLVGNACLGEAVQFTNTSTLNGGSQISGYLWNFDDPLSGSNTSTDPNPTHLFSAVGSYNVSLKATNSDGCANTHTLSPPLVVSPKPSVDFTFQNGNQNWEILFHNITGATVGNNLVWDFGDGAYGYGPDPSHVYQGPGNFLVTLTATDAINGCSNSIQQQVSIQGNASAFFTTDSPKCIGDTMHFTPQIPGGNIVKEVWNYGDGNIVPYTAPPFPVFATHIYTASGTFTVTRTVTYITNFFESFSIQVVVFPKPTSNFTYSNNPTFPDTIACANQAVFFTDLSYSTSGNIIDWFWDFGDAGSGINNTSVLQNPQHTFSGVNQIYDVSLTVTDNINNCKNTVVKHVIVKPPVPVDFTFTNNTCLNQVVSFNANLSVMTPGNIAVWDWNFGDGTAHSANPGNAAHLYTTAGTYTAVLTVTDIIGCTNSISKIVTVMPKPVPGFTFASPTCDSIAVQFTDQSYVPAGFPGYIEQWVWHWGDNSSDTINQPASANKTHVFPGGIYSFNVTLVVKSSFGCKDSITRQVHLIPAPKASFEVVPGTPSCATQVVQFNDLSQTNGGGNIVSWLWNFNDPGSGSNNTSTSPNPSHIFGTAGTYLVTLTVTNANGCSHTITLPILIHLLPVANFTFDTACAGGTTHFKDTSIFNASAIVSYSWVFGDGGASTLQSPLHTYSTFGVYNVTLTIINTNGCINSVTKQVMVAPKPVPAFTFSAASCVGNPVTFTDLSFIPSGFSGYIKTWIWNFGDGTAPQIKNYPESPNITYTFAGIATSHVVRLTIITTSNCTDSLEKTVNSIPSPKSNFGFSSTNCIGQAVQFTDLSQTNGGGSIQNWNWTFGDPLSGSNNISTLQNPIHSFSVVDTFTVRLAITSTNGCINTHDTTIIIHALPVANFSADTACEGGITQFTDQSVSQDTIISYSWTFGDGGASTSKNPQHTYSAYGNYIATLTIVNSKGCMHSVSKLIFVNPKPVAEFSYSPASCVHNPVSFFNQSFVPGGFSSSIKTWEWDFGDGSTKTITFPGIPDVIHTFLGDATSHVVRLTVTTTKNCVSYIEKTVTSVPAPLANFAFSSNLCANQPVQFNDLSQTNGGSSIQSWSWNFADPPSGANNTATIQNPIHQFTTATLSPFNVVLVVTNGNGCKDTLQQSIAVNARPISNFKADTVCQGTVTPFTDISSSPSSLITSRFWEFGDGTTSTSQNPDHLYATSGNFNVKLTVTDSTGCQKDTIKPILVLGKPIVSFSYSSPNCANDSVQFNDLSSTPHGSLKQWVWDFGDGTPPVTVNFPGNQNVKHKFSNGGNYNVILTILTTDSCFAQKINTVQIGARPLANFSFTPSSCALTPVQFTDLSQINGGPAITAWSWNFGNFASGTNNTSTSQNPVHSFTAGGTFIVRLMVTNANGCIDSLPGGKPVTVNVKPLANFSADTVCQGTITSFADSSKSLPGTITSRYWEFGDGQNSTSPNPVHLYATSGTFNVKLTVTNSFGCQKDTTKSVLVLGKPVVSFSYSSPNCSNDSVQFNDLSSTPHGSIQKWIWDFGDGTPPVTRLFPENQNIKHKFANGGSFNVTLTIKTSDSCEAFKTNLVQIGFKPLANFSFTPNIPCALSLVQFTDLTQVNGGAAITAWSWNFGDPGSGTNNTATAQNPNHLFTVEGTDTVRLIATNANGCVDTIKYTVLINAAPTADFIFDTACMSSPTQFTDSSTTASGTIMTWNWNFGDPGSGTNNTSTLEDPTHIYNTQGVFTVHLEVTNSNQCVKDTSKQITVNPKPNAIFEYSAVCVNSPTQFTDVSTAPGSSIKNWTWNFGDGTPDVTIQNPTHIYLTAGTFMVKLVVRNLANCLDSVIIPVISRPTPVANFTYTSYFCPKGKVDFQDVSTATGGTIAERLWTFEPGYTSNVSNPSHTFPVYNVYDTVTLIVTDTYGCKDTIRDTTVFIKPAFAFSFTNDTKCFGYPTKFTPVNNTPGDTLYSVAWNFGDPGVNNSSTLYSPTHTFSRPGTFVVKMRAYNSDNCVDSVFREVTVYAPPQPLFTYISTPCDSSIHFTDSTQIIGSGTIATWEWKWGDSTASTIINAPGPGDTSHLYNYAGIRSVTLIMTSQYGCIDSITQNVQRFPCIKAGFTYADTLCARYRIAFSDSSLPVTRINQWKWSWGDGTPDTTYSTHSSPIYHTFANSGTYPVILEIQAVVNGSTIIDNMAGSVTINPTPETHFANVPVCLNEITLFRDTSTTFGENNTNWNWNFSASPTDVSSLKNPPHKYDTAGIYNVKLVVNNRFGCKDSLTKPTRVYGLPVAHYNTTAACTGDPTFFTDKSNPSDTTLGFWHWFFGDPTSGSNNLSTKQNPYHTYTAIGSDIVRLIVKDNFGCIDTVDSTIVVNITPVSAFTMINDYNGKQGQIKLNNLSTGAETYFWDFGNGKNSSEVNPVATFTEDDTYRIKLISQNQYECSDTTIYEYKLLFKGLYVPNAFAPTSTSLGVRLFQPVGRNLTQYHVMVFDIWGHLMWESTKLTDGIPSEGWDGTFNGQLMPQGNYVWKISALFIDGSPWNGSDLGVGASGTTKGNVSLIR